ncbi:MAG: hypothetical protein ACKVOK_01345 [Flavobacteriales bacterium]
MNANTIAMLALRFQINAVDFFRKLSSGYSPQSPDSPILASKLPLFSNQVTADDSTRIERLNTELGTVEGVWDEASKSVVQTSTNEVTIKIDGVRKTRTYKTIRRIFMRGGIPVMTIWLEKYADQFSRNWNIISANKPYLLKIEEEYASYLGTVRPINGFPAIELINFMATATREYKYRPLQFTQQELVASVVASEVVNNEISINVSSTAQGNPVSTQKTYAQLTGDKKSSAIFIQRKSAKLSSDLNKRDCLPVFNYPTSAPTFNYYASENFRDTNGNYVQSIGTGTVILGGLNKYNYYNE